MGFCRSVLISGPWWGKRNTRRIGIPYNTSKEVHRKGPGHAERVQTPQKEFLITKARKMQETK